MAMTPAPATGTPDPSSQQLDPVWASVFAKGGRTLPGAAPPAAPTVATPAGTTPPAPPPVAPSPSTPPGLDPAWGPVFEKVGRPLVAAPQPQQIDPHDPNNAADIRNESWYQSLLGHVGHAFGQIASSPGGAGQEFGHSLSMGFDEIAIPLVPAIYNSLAKGIPFTKAYDAAVEAQRSARKQWEDENPDAAWGAWGAGIAAPALLSAGAAPLARAALAASNPVLRGSLAAAARLGLTMDGATVGKAAVMGGLGGFGMTEGDIKDRLEGAALGASGGAIISKAASALGGATTAVRDAWQSRAGASMARAVPAARGMLTDTEKALAPGGGAVISEAPLTTKGYQFPLGVSGAVDVPSTTAAGGMGGSPALAAMERLSNITNDSAVINRATGQANAIRDAVQSPTGLNIPDVQVNAASENIAQALRDAHGVFRQEIERLYSAPALAGKSINVHAVQDAVQKAVDSLPQRYQGMIAGSGDLEATLANLHQLTGSASLADINWVRSDMMQIARSAAASGDTFKARVANTVAASMRTEIARGLSGDPAALAAYNAAQSQTRLMTKLYGQPVFADLVRANAWGNQGADTRTIASKLFGTQGAAIGEKYPGQIANISDQLEKIRMQWNAVGNSGFNPATVGRVQDALVTNYRAAIGNSILDAATDKGRMGTAGEPLYNMTVLRRLLKTNTDNGWFARSRMFTPDQLGLINDISSSAERAARVDMLRGGKGSETAERVAQMMQQPAKMLDLFASPLMQGGQNLIGKAKSTGMALVLSHMLGPVVGEHLADLMGFVAAAGSHPGAPGPRVLARYQPAMDAARQALNEAINDPTKAAALRQGATVKAFNQMTPAMKGWLTNSLRAIALQYTGHSAGLPQQPPAQPVAAQ